MKHTQKIILFTSSALFFIGILVGTLYMAFSDTDDNLYTYLSQLFISFPAAENHFTVFKSSLWENIRIFIILTVCGFFKLGAVGSFSCCAVKGFVNGFTSAAFIRYYSVRGLLVPLSSLFSTLLFVPSLILFASFSANFSFRKKEKNTIGAFLMLSLIFLAVFCVISFIDGYVTTTFMKLFKPFIINVSQIPST